MLFRFARALLPTLVSVALLGAVALATTYPAGVMQTLQVLGLTSAGQLCNSSSGVVSTTTGTCPGVTAGNAPVLLATLTASNSASLSDTTHFTSAYSEYDIKLENLVPATGGATLEALVQSGGSFQSSSYLAEYISSYNGGTPTAGTSMSVIVLSSAYNSPGLSCAAHISNVAQTTAPKTLFGTCFASVAFTAQPLLESFGGIWNGGNGPVTGIEFLFGSGAIASGVIKIYGYN